MKTISRVAGFLLCAALTVCLGDALAADVTRGPYLQLETPGSIVVRWRTDQPTGSVVRYGSVQGSLNDTVTASGNTTEHIVELSGLLPDTLYYYSVGDSSGPLAGGDSSHFFRTAPTPGTEKPTRIWVIGDSGTADANARAVRDAYKNYTGSRGTDLWLMLGDNAYNSGTDNEYQAAVFETYPEILRQAALWPTLGNHDGYTADSASQSGPYYDIFTLPTNGEAGGEASGTEAYYAFDYGNIHFICLESYETERSTNGAMMTWLQSDLEQNDKPWVIAFWHHPPYTKGSHNSDTEGNLIDMRQNALPILEEWGVDLVLGGHSHSYERSYLLDGHYGNSGTLDGTMIVDGGDGSDTGDGAYEKSNGVAVPHEGAVYAVAGSSGKLSGGSLNHPAMYVSMNTLGSMVLDVSGNRLDAVFLDNTGAVGDTFTIMKGDDTTPPVLVAASSLDDVSVSVQFSERLEPIGAETLSNYQIDQGVAVSAATLGADGRSVTLDTSVLAEGLTYTLTVNGLSDLADNPIAANSQAQFSFVTLVTKSFKDGVSPTGAYAGTRDTYLSQNSSNENFGGATDLVVDGDDPVGSGNDLATLIAWDLSEIPVDAQVESASIAINVFNVSSGAYELFEVLRDWDESAATWNQAASGASWETAGAKGTSDRGSSVLGTVSASSTGNYSLDLNASGLAVIQGWVDGSFPNYGLILANSSTTDGLDFDSSDSSAANRPQLTITYSVPATSSDIEPPTSPANLRQTDVTSTTVMLAWDAATDNVGVVGYKVNRDGNLIATVAGTSYEDTDLQPGTGYGYRVAAYDAANNESLPAGPLAVTTDTVPLAHVQDISLQVVDAGSTRQATSQVTVLDGTAQPVTGATVQADWSGLASGTVSGITLADGTVSFASGDVPSAVFGQLVFTVTDVSAAGYYYDQAGNSETTDCVTTEGTDCLSVPGAPGAPAGLTALGALSTIDLDWDDSADPDVTGYTVYRSATSGSGFQRLVSVASSAYSDGTVSVGVPYYYAVVAYYSTGAESTFSGEAWAVAGETTLSFQDGVSPVASYAGTRDTYIAQANPSNNSGSDVDLQADGDDPPGSGNDLSSLVAWDLSAVPDGAVIESASIEIEVFNGSTGSYQFYEVKRDWNESQATWNEAASGSGWSQPGASHTDDRGTQALATISASSTGTYSVDLGADGLSVLQAWVDGVRPNNGFILANDATTDGLDFHSSEASTAAYRPKLTLSYVIPDLNHAPTAGFTHGVSDLTASFTDTSSDSDGTIASWSWDFGDGNTSSVQFPSHTYAAAGTYTASLTVTDDGGATDSTSTSVTIGVVVLDVRVTQSSDDAEELIDPSPSQSYSTGNVTFTSSDLEMVDDSGWHGGDQAVGIRFQNLSIPQGATILSAYLEFTTDETTSGSTTVEIRAQDDDDAVTFSTASGNISSRPITSASVSWTIDGWNTVGQLDTTPDLTALVQEVVDRAGWTQANSMAFVITGSGKRVAESYDGVAGSAPLLHVEFGTPVANVPPTAAFTHSVSDLTASFTDTSSDSDGTIASWSWDFGDGNTSSVQSPSHTYAAAGTYTVSLTVTDDDGASDGTGAAVTVTAPNQAPTAVLGASPTAGEDPLTVDFDANASSDSDGSIVSYAWDFGDGASGSGASPSHTYAAGSHNVILTVTDDDGATDTASTTINVSEPPTTGPAISTGTVTGVGSSGWTTVILPRSYTSMVVVASANYDAGSVPGVVRIQNAGVDRFEVRMDVAANSGDITDVTVHYVAVEEGVYTAAEHGVTMEAVKFNSTVADRSGSWVGAAQSYANVYSSPVVIGQVMTYNDAGFSVFWARGSSRTAPPSAGSLYVGKHVAQDADRTREDETVGYLVIEAGQGTMGGLAYAAGVGADSVKGVTNSPPYNYATSGLQNGTTAVVGSAAMDGGDGGWPVLYGANPVGGGSLSLAIDEDQIKDTERNHTTEQVAYLVLGPAAP